MYRNYGTPTPRLTTKDSTDVHLMKVQSSEIEERLQSAEILLHTMYRLLKKRGLTTEEFENELDEVTQLHYTKRNATPNVICPKCGKQMQIGNITSTTANCMYCGAKKTFSPFAKYEFTEDLNGASEPIEDEPLI